MSYTLFRRPFLFLCFAFIIECANSQTIDPLAYVDPFHGTERGNTFPGACVPFGLMKAGPDVQKPHPTSGYSEKGLIEGFSHMHTSGTGGGGRYGNFLIVPFMGAYNPKERLANRRNEAASPGYYQVTLTRRSGDVESKIAASEFGAAYKFTYHSWAKAKSHEANLLFDLAHVVSRTSTPDNTNHRFTGGMVEIINDSTIVAEATFAGGWGGQNPYKAYFALIVTGKLKVEGLLGEDSLLRLGQKSTASNTFAGCLFAGKLRNDETVAASVGISLVSKEQALHEAYKVASFEKALAEAETKWRAVLSTIMVDNGTIAQKRLFYSCLYHTFLMPVRLPEGYYPVGLIKSGTLYWDHYCLWDTWRSVMPLHRMLVPTYQAEIVNSLLSIAESKGYLPDAWVAGDYAQMQGGTSADMVIADAIVHKLPNVSVSRGLAALRRNLKPSADPYRYGRELVVGSDKVPYCSSTVKNGMSKSLEYAYGDYCISEVARIAGDLHLADSLHKASNSIFSYFDKRTKTFRPKSAKGLFVDTFFVDFTRPDSWNGPHFYEASARTYSMFVPHAYPKLIKLHGGKKIFKQSLDSIFNTCRYSIENEPAFLTPFLYLIAGDTAKANEVISAVRDKEFHMGRNGLPGQDDSGALSSWYVWSAIGVFPIAGTLKYFNFEPVFTNLVIKPL